MIIQNTIIGGTSAIICLSHEKVSTHYPFSILVYLIIKKFQKKKKRERERNHKAHATSNKTHNINTNNNNKQMTMEDKRRKD